MKQSRQKLFSKCDVPSLFLRSVAQHLMECVFAVGLAVILMVLGFVLFLSVLAWVSDSTSIRFAF